MVAGLTVSETAFVVSKCPNALENVLQSVLPCVFVLALSDSEVSIAFQCSNSMWSLALPLMSGLLGTGTRLMTLFASQSST